MKVNDFKLAWEEQWECTVVVRCAGCGEPFAYYHDTDAMGPPWHVYAGLHEIVEDDLRTWWLCDKCYDEYRKDNPDE